MTPDRTSNDAERRLLAAVELFETGVRIMRENLRRQYPEATGKELETRLFAWLQHRPGAEFGDAIGRVIHLPDTRA